MAADDRRKYYNITVNLRKSAQISVNLREKIKNQKI